MNRQAPSLATATRMAAEAGGTINVGDRVVNPAGARIPIARPYLAQSAQEPVHDGRIDAVVEMMRAQSQVLAAQLEALPAIVGKFAEAMAAGRAVAQPIGQEQTPTAAPRPAMRPVRFVIDRDDDGEPVAMSIEYGPGTPTKRASLRPIKGPDGLVHEVKAEY